MSRITVTGSQGFIGHHLVERLIESGDEVTCLTRRASSWDEQQGSQLRVVRGDLDNLDSLREAIAGSDVVYHLAGLTHARTPGELLQVNGVGARNVAHVCALQPHPPVLVSVSSLAAAGPSTNRRAVRETDPARPVSQYGRSKRAGELAVAAYVHKVPITVVRPPMVFGPRDRVSLDLFRAIRLTRIHMTAGYGRGRFAVICVHELIDALILAAQRGQRIPAEDASNEHFASGCYSFANRERITYLDLGRRIAEALDHRILPVVMPAALVWTVGTVCDLVGHLRRESIMLSRDKAREATASGWDCSTERAERELGFTPPDNLRERLRETAEWYIEAGWLK